jgi:uncharacterized protein
MEVLSQPWPWYLAGPLVGLTVPLLLIFANRAFGISSSLRHMCAACAPGKVPYFQYDWKSSLWNLVFVAGILIGGFLGGVVFRNPAPVQISAATHSDLAAIGVTEFSTLIPLDLFNFAAILTLPGFVLMVIGGFLVGFGARWAGGCTSGHAITGMANLQPASLLSVVSFFAGGLLVTHLILGWLLGFK